MQVFACIIAVSYTHLDVYKRQGYATGRAEDYTMPALHDIYAPAPCRSLDEIERDPGIREFWGESLKRHWEKMESMPGCLGGAILAAIDEEGVVLDLSLIHI